MINKSTRQVESLDIVKQNNFKGILNYCVRFGKTRVGIKVYESYKELYTPKDIILIIVPSATIKLSWIKELNILGLDPNLFNIVTIGQLLNISKLPKISLLIVDECHKFVSERYYSILSNINYENIIMLTASLPANGKLKMLTDLAPVIDIISEKEAIENKWISNYVEYNIALSLDEDSVIKYAEHTNNISAIFSKYKNLENSILFNNEPIFNDLLDLLLSLNNGKHSKVFGYIDAVDIAKAISIKMGHDVRTDNIWEFGFILNEAREFQNSLRSRNNLLIANRIKLNAVLEIYKKLKFPTICFSESIGFADAIAENLNKTYGDISISFHSKIKSSPLINPETQDYYRYISGSKTGMPKTFSKKKQLEYYIEAFNNHMINFISTVKSLDEGITIKNAECIITTAGSMNPIQYEQRTGRGKTLVDDNKVAKIYNLYFDDFTYEGINYKSRDKLKLYERQRYNPNIIEISLSDV